MPTTPTPLPKVRKTPIGELTPHPDNPRRGDIDAIANSLTAHGQYRPIVANTRTGHVLAGNHTLAAAQSLGWTHLQVAWIDVDDDTERRILLVDNRTADMGDYDSDALVGLLDTLQHTDLELAGTGYTPQDLADLLPKDRLEPADPIPLPTVTTSQPGDIWQVGPHRVGCGDATDPDFTAALIDGLSLEAIITDPPYGVDYRGGPSHPRNAIVADALSPSALQALLTDSLTRGITHLRPAGAIYLFGPGGPTSLVFSQVMTDLGLWRQTLLWTKDRHTLGRSDYQNRHEVIWYGTLDEPAEQIYYGWTPGAAHRWYGGRRQTTLLDFPRPSRSDLHPTMKPPELIAQLVTNSTQPGDVVYDPFAGSGTTAAVAHTHNRTAITCDIEPAYTDVTIARLLATDPTLQATHTTTGAVWTPAETP